MYMKRLTEVLCAGLLAATIGISTLSAQATGGDAGTVAAITKLEQESVKATLGGGPALKQYNERYLASDFVGGTSFGKWETKADIIKDSENPANKTKSMTLQDLKVSAYGNAALARYQLAYDDMYNGERRAR